MKEAHSVVHSVLFTEKTSCLSSKLNQYTFRVLSSANKIQTKQAIEQIFNKKIVAINTMSYFGKKKRGYRFANFGRRANWKKAIVTLHGEETLELV